MSKQILLVICSFLILVIAGKSQNNYNEVSLPELMKKKKEGDPNIVIVDVRSDREFYDSASMQKQQNIGHIKGALHISVQDLDQKPEAVKQLEAYKDKEIYLICSHSYRSRVASNILLKNGYTHVNNVRGGMTEWYRRYDDLSPYMADFLETENAYKNISPSQLFTQLDQNKNVLLIGVSTPPRYFYDTSTIKFYSYYPGFKNAVYYDYADSLKVLELVQKDKTRPVVLYNLVNYGAAELADWLTKKGVPQVSYLVGNINLFYEYVLNKNFTKKAEKFLSPKNSIRFTTAPVYCNMLKEQKDIQLIDLRHDSLFNKINEGVKHDYKHLKDATNFFSDLGADQFIQKYPDKKKEYLLASEYGTVGLELADALTKKGYTIYWLLGGTERWEWYMNNIETFSCMDRLVTN